MFVPRRAWTGKSRQRVRLVYLQVMLCSDGPDSEDRTRSTKIYVGLSTACSTLPQTKNRVLREKMFHVKRIRGKVLA